RKCARFFRNGRQNRFEDGSMKMASAGPGSVLEMVGGWSNAEPLHFVKQGGAFEAEPCGGSARATELPVCTLTGNENFLADFVFERWIGDIELSGFGYFRE